MATTNDRVIEEALSLPADARLSLIEKLLTSLNLPSDEEVLGQKKRNVAFPKLRKARLSWFPVRKSSPKSEQSTGNEILFPRVCGNGV